MPTVVPSFEVLQPAEGLTPMPQSGFALVLEDNGRLTPLEGAVVELRVCGPGMLSAIIRIPGKDPHETGYVPGPAN